MQERLSLAQLSLWIYKQQVSTTANGVDDHTHSATCFGSFVMCLRSLFTLSVATAAALATNGLFQAPGFSLDIKGKPAAELLDGTIEASVCGELTMRPAGMDPVRDLASVTDRRLSDESPFARITIPHISSSCKKAGPISRMAVPSSIMRSGSQNYPLSQRLRTGRQMLTRSSAKTLTQGRRRKDLCTLHITSPLVRSAEAKIHCAGLSTS